MPSKSSSENSAGSSDTKGVTPEQPELCGGTTGFLMMMVMFFILFMMINPGLRESIAISLDVVFSPMFAFDYQYPVLTLIFASLFMVFWSTLIRHFMTDWIGIARAQKFMNAYQKEKMDAMTSGNTVKLKKLEELTPEISKHNITLMTSNFKPLVFTMIFFIIVFPWLWAVYFDNLSYHYITLPGIAKWNLNEPMQVCPGGFSSWILVYIVLSFPISFLLQNAMKYISFTSKLRKSEVKEEGLLENKIATLNEKIEEYSERGIQTQKARELLTQTKQKIMDKDYLHASALIDEADEYLDNKTQTYERIIGLINQAEDMIKNAENKGIKITDAVKSLENSRKALARNDDTHAIYYAKESQRHIKESRQQHKEAEETLSSIKAVLYDLRDVKTTEADSLFNKAQNAMNDKDYSSVIKYSKETKQKAEETSNIYSEAKKSVELAKSNIDNIRHLDLNIPKAQELYKKAETELKINNYSSAKEIAEQCISLVTKEKEKYQNAQESVSFAKLVISNAISFGASVPEAERYAADAEAALDHKDYERAIELANRAKDIAETAKRQQQRLAKRK